MRVTPRDKTRPANLHEDCYEYYCSWKVYLAARSSVPMGFSLKAWAEPSKQLCDNLCGAACQASRTRDLLSARSLEVP